jgi:hypothetical protein
MVGRSGGGKSLKARPINWGFSITSNRIHARFGSGRSRTALDITFGNVGAPPRFEPRMEVSQPSLLNDIIVPFLGCSPI